MKYIAAAMLSVLIMSVLKAAEPRVPLLKLTLDASDGHPLSVEELRSFDSVEACDQFILTVGPKKPADGKIELLACAVPLTRV